MFRHEQTQRQYKIKHCVIYGPEVSFGLGGVGGMEWNFWSDKKCCFLN